MAVAAEVPSKYDVVISGEGFRFAESEERAAYGLTPTFAQRRAESYTDSQFDFWLTAAQSDWSLGEGQLFFRSDEDRSRRYNVAVGADITTPGAIKPFKSNMTITTSSTALRAMTTRSTVNQSVYIADTTNLYSAATPDAGSLTDHGAHGLGAAASLFGMCSDGSDIYMSTTSAGTVGVRKWNGSAYSTFSASGADSLTFLNNTLYGMRADNAKLVRWDTAGAQTEIFQWKQADGDARGGTPSRIKAYGGQLLILWSDGPEGPELWQYNGVAPAMVAQFPNNFYASDMEVLNGTVFVSGIHIRHTSSSNLQVRPAVYYYANGSVGLLWQQQAGVSSAGEWKGTAASVAAAVKVALTTFNGRLVFNDFAGAILMYEPSDGSIFTPFQGVTATSTPRLAASARMVAFAVGGTGVSLWPGTSDSNYSFYTSQYDFDSSLNKYFKSVKIDKETGGTTSVEYYLNGDVSSPVSLGSIVSGVETAIGVSGRTIAFKLAGTGTVRRIYCRAAPILDQFKRREYTLDLSGADGESPIQLRDGTFHTKDGHELAAALNTTMLATAPFSITDRFGTFTGLIEPDGSQIIETRPGVYRATIRVREV